MAIQIEGSVGKRGENRAQDVKAVKQRLADLGFQFFAIDGKADQGLDLAIRIFQSILKGSNRLGDVDGRIDVGHRTIRFLQATNAPRWQTMPLQGPGFINFELQDTSDQHDFGTSWLAETIKGAGAAYEREYLRTHSGAALLAINDVSLPRGGDTPDHAGHETGLACDIRLPKKDGTSGGVRNPNTNTSYDRDAMRAQLLAIRQQPLFRRAFFNDRVLIDEGLCAPLGGHNNHVHFEINPPEPD